MDNTHHTRELIGQVIAGKYELVEKLASGSHSSVYWGKDLDGGTDVAVKALTAESDDPFASDRLHREGTVLRLLDDFPGCPKLLARVFADNGELMLLLELLDGMSLGAMLERGSRSLELEEVQEGLAPVIQVLSSLHQRGIIHRNLCPENIYRSWDPPRFLLLGFGEAQFTRSGVPSSSSYCGLPKYVAPEVWLGMPDIDQRADIYSMAVVIFRALAGRCPFESESSIELVNIVPKAERPSLVSLRPNLPSALDDWMTIALCPERHGRFDNIDAMWKAFLRASGSSVPESRADEPPRRIA